MKIRFIAVVALAFVFAITGIASAVVLSSDTQYLGKVKEIKGDKMTIETIGEKKAQTIEITILDHVLIMENSRGKILSVSDIKPGVTVNVNGWPSGGKWYARTIWVEFKEDYVTKAILKDAKDGKYYKEIEP